MVRVLASGSLDATQRGLAAARLLGWIRTG